jgi:hypothetical protein
MRIILAHGTVKRALCGSFEVCGDFTDLQWVAEQILAKTTAAEGGSYGWISIPERPPEHGQPNTPPWCWESNEAVEEEVR